MLNHYSSVRKLVDFKVRAAFDFLQEVNWVFGDRLGPLHCELQSLPPSTQFLSLCVFLLLQYALCSLQIRQRV